MPGLGAALGGLPVPTVPKEGLNKEAGAQLASAASVVREGDRHVDPVVASSLQPQGAKGTPDTDPRPVAGVGTSQLVGSGTTLKAVGVPEEDATVPSKALPPGSGQQSLTGAQSPGASPMKSGAGFIFL